MSCNLLSVSQFLEKQKFTVCFTNKVYVVQDPNSRNLIGAGKQRNGDYEFCPVHHV